MRLRRPRQGGACWMATLLWDQLRFDEVWFAALPPSREGTNWLNILKTLVGYQLISPGSEWRLHRHWFEHGAMGDLLGEDLALVQPNNLYRCLDKLTAHKQAMFTFLVSVGANAIDVVVTLLMALRCFPFVKSAPRAYRLKASNAAPPISTCTGAMPAA